MFKKINNFLKRDIRWKLIKVSNLTKLNFIYPKKFSLNGILGLYTKFIIRLIVSEKISENRKNLIKKNFNLTTHIPNRINFLISTPASGSMFVRNMMSSYTELLYKVGDGFPKYDNLNNDYIFACSPIFAADLFNAIDIKKHGFINDFKYIDEQQFNKNKIIFSRYPLTRVDLYDLNDIRPVILFREPLDQITSRYTRSDKRKDIDKSKAVDISLLNSRISEYESYVKYWSKYIENKKKEIDYLLINFQNLVSNSEECFKKILTFYNYEINEEYIKKVVFIHSKENTQQFFKTIKNYNITRFTDPEIKQRQKEMITNQFKDIKSNIDILKNFNILNDASKDN